MSDDIQMKNWWYFYDIFDENWKMTVTFLAELFFLWLTKVIYCVTSFLLAAGHFAPG